jgi:hypothetical protein
MKEETKTGREEMKATVSVIQEKMGTMTSSISSKLERALKHHRKDVHVCVDPRTLGFRKELDKKFEETQVDLETVKTTRTKSLLETTADTRKDLHEKLGLMIQIETQTTRTLVKDTRGELRMQLEQVEARDACKFSRYYTAEARSELGSCQRTGTGAGVAQTPKFDGLTSWAMFRPQFQTVAEHNGWTSYDKAAYLIAALDEPAAHIPHSVPIGARYERLLLRSRIAKAITC